MRYPASEKLEIIRIVEQSHLPIKATLDKLAIPRPTFYRWYDRFLAHGVEGLEDRHSAPSRVWNRIPDDVRSRIIDMVLEQPELSPRELAVRFTDTEKYFTADLTMEWVTSMGRQPSWSIRLADVRCFAQHLTHFDPLTEVPPSDAVAPTRRTKPYIYSEVEIQALLAAALSLPPANALSIGLSRRQLERLFMGETKSSPALIYRRVRMERAKQLLIKTKASLIEVALEVGFENASHFSRAFSQTFGKSPTRMRATDLSYHAL